MYVFILIFLPIFACFLIFEHTAKDLIIKFSNYRKFMKKNKKEFKNYFDFVKKNINHIVKVEDMYVFFPEDADSHLAYFVNCLSYKVKHEGYKIDLGNSYGIMKDLERLIYIDTSDNTFYYEEYWIKIQKDIIKYIKKNNKKFHSWSVFERRIEYLRGTIDNYLKELKKYE